MDLKKELMEFVEANNWFSLEDSKNAESVIDVYLKTYKKQYDIQRVSQQRELLKTFCKYIDIESRAHPDDVATDIENHIKVFNCG